MNFISSHPSERTRVIFASAFGLGLMPYMPGSFGALLGVAFHLAVLGLTWPARMVVLALAFLMVAWGTLALTPWAQGHWHHKDPSKFVLDEVAGYLLTALLLTPLLPTRWVIGGGFVAFRVLDIIKIPPAWQIDRQGTGGWAILLDDCVSALYAALLLSFIYFYWVKK